MKGKVRGVSGNCHVCLRPWPDAQNSFKWRAMTPSCLSDMVLEQSEGAQSISGWVISLIILIMLTKTGVIWIMVVIYSRKKNDFSASTPKPIKNALDL